MAAYKTLNSQDIIISPLEVSKGFTFRGNAMTASNVDINRYLGNQYGTQQSTGYVTQISQSSVYWSTQQLYYSNYISSSNGEVQIANTQSINPDGTTSGRMASNAFVNFEQTDLNPYKYWPTSSITSSQLYIGVMSIPKALFGDYIQPNTLHITTPSGSYFDDGEGRLKRLNDNNTSSIYVGNVIYEHGIVVLTGGTRTEGTGENSEYGTSNYGTGIWGGRSIDNNHILNFVTSSNVTCSFSSSFTIYETQYKCTIGESEFNYTLNPSTISGTSNDGTVYNYVTASFFSPYVTTVGLYNNEFELVAVGKLAQPLPTSQTTDTTILVNIDRQ
jgi:hypothetical protein